MTRAHRLQLTPAGGPLLTHTGLPLYCVAAGVPTAPHHGRAHDEGAQLFSRRFPHHPTFFFKGYVLPTSAANPPTHQSLG